MKYLIIFLGIVLVIFTTSLTFSKQKKDCNEILKLLTSDSIKYWDIDENEKPSRGYLFNKDGEMESYKIINNKRVIVDSDIFRVWRCIDDTLLTLNSHPAQVLKFTETQLIIKMIDNNELVSLKKSNYQNNSIDSIIDVPFLAHLQIDTVYLAPTRSQ